MKMFKLSWIVEFHESYHSFLFYFMSCSVTVVHCRLMGITPWIPKMTKVYGHSLKMYCLFCTRIILDFYVWAWKTKHGSRKSTNLRKTAIYCVFFSVQAKVTHALAQNQRSFLSGPILLRDDIKSYEKTSVLNSFKTAWSRLFKPKFPTSVLQ